jgi:hypothetical protein
VIEYTRADWVSDNRTFAGSLETVGTQTLG